MSRRSRPRYYPARIACSVCGSAQTIQRSRERQRGVGHVKDIYCAQCHKVTPHVERGPHQGSGDELSVLMQRLNSAVARADRPEAYGVAARIVQLLREESA